MIIKKQQKRGDTLIEILFAIAVFGIIAISTIAVMNRGISNAQASLESTTARTEIEAQAEALRFIHNAYSADPEGRYAGIWKKIVGFAGNAETIPSASVATCSTAYSADKNDTNSLFSQQNPGFIINTRLLYDSTKNEDDVVIGAIDGENLQTNIFTESPLYPRLIYKKSYGTSTNDGALKENLSNTDYKYLNTAEGIWIVVTSDESNSFYDFYIRTCWNAPGADTASTISTAIRLYNPDVAVTQNDKIQFQIRYHLPIDGNWNFNPVPFATQLHEAALSAYTFTINQPEPTISPTPAYLSGKYFLGWSKSTTGNTSTYYNKTTINNIMTNNGLTNNTTKNRLSLSAKTSSGTTDLYAIYGYKYDIKMDCSSGGTGAPCSNHLTYLARGGHSYGNDYKIPTSIPTYVDSNDDVWDLAGWQATGNGSDSTKYQPGQTYTKLTNANTNLVFKPIWTGYHYKLYYEDNADGDEVNNMPSDIVNHNPSNDASYNFGTIPDTTPTRDCHTFLGWSENPDATTATYHSGDAIPLATPTKQTIKLYAVWYKDVVCSSYKVVLTWGQNPSDLDSHLVITDPDGNTEEVYYSHKTSRDGSVTLDLDDTNGYGPETILINPKKNYKYKYYVHRYAGSSNIYLSPTTVTLTYAGGTGIQIYNAPSTATTDDWYIFELTVNNRGYVTRTNL